MKLLIMTLFLILSSAVYGETKFLNNQNSVKHPTTLSNIEDKRMIAGQFEISRKKSSKKSYLDGLRSKLDGCKGIVRY